MIILAGAVADPVLPAAYAGLTLWSILYGIAVFLISCLILWLIIYSSVRAALTLHRRQQAEDIAFQQAIAAQRAR